LKAAPSYSGRDTKCPKCKNKIVVPTVDGPSFEQNEDPPAFLEAKSTFVEAPGKESPYRRKLSPGSIAGILLFVIAFVSIGGAFWLGLADLQNRAPAIAQNENSGSTPPPPPPKRTPVAVPEVMEWFKKHAHDPDSATFDDWTTVEPIRLFDEDATIVAVSIRARNGFGARILNRRVFIMRNGKVTGSIDTSSPKDLGKALRKDAFAATKEARDIINEIEDNE
jgi:hypothetical protein